MIVARRRMPVSYTFVTPGDRPYRGLRQPRANSGSDSGLGQHKIREEVAAARKQLLETLATDDLPCLELEGYPAMSEPVYGSPFHFTGMGLADPIGAS